MRLVTDIQPEDDQLRDLKDEYDSHMSELQDDLDVAAGGGGGDSDEEAASGKGSFGGSGVGLKVFDREYWKVS